MKKLLRNILLISIILSSIFSYRIVFGASFNDYINGIVVSSENEAATGACKNKCNDGYYQLTFGLPFRRMSRCACVPVNQGIGAIMASLIQFLLSSIGVIAVIILIIAGFMMAFAAGNQKTIKQAKDMIKNSMIGLVVVIFSGSILAIINPDLITEGIFGINMIKIDVKCVDDAKDRSDGSADGYYADPETGKKYAKTCNNFCDANGACVTAQTGSICRQLDTECGANAKCAFVDAGKNGVGESGVVGVCIQKDQTLAYIGDTCNINTNYCAPFFQYNTGGGYIASSPSYCLPSGSKNVCMQASNGSNGVDPTKSTVGSGELCGVSNDNKGCISGYKCMKCDNFSSAGTGSCGSEENNFRCYPGSCQKILPIGETSASCSATGQCCVNGSVCDTDNICKLQ